MAQSLARIEMVKGLYEAAVLDDRIVGLVDFGSGGQGRIDEWSDVDAAVILHGTDCYAFQQDWLSWARRFGEILHFLKGNNSCPWAIYVAEPIPLRVDFIFCSGADLFWGHGLPRWPEDKSDLERMIWYETDDKQVTEDIRRHIGKKEHLRPMEKLFEEQSDSLWHHLQYLYSKFQRGELWVAREVFHKEVLERLLVLLRIEAKAFDRLSSAHAGWNVEHSLSPERLKQLNACIPPADRQSFKECLHNTAQLGFAVCTTLGDRYEVQWSKALGEKLITMTAN